MPSNLVIGLVAPSQKSLGTTVIDNADAGMRIHVGIISKVE